MDQGVVAPAVDRLPQAADVHVDQVALRVEVQVPHPLEQHGTRHQLPGATHEELEQLHLARRELELASAARHTPLEQVELEILDLQPCEIGRIRSPPQQRLDARQQ